MITTFERFVMDGKVMVKSGIVSMPASRLFVPEPVYVSPLPIIHCAVVPAFSVVSAAAYLPLMVAFGPPMIRPLVPPAAQTAQSATCHPVGCADALVCQTVVVSADTFVGVPLLLISSLVSLMPVAYGVRSWSSGTGHGETQGPDRLVHIRGVKLQVEQMHRDGVRGVVDVKGGAGVFRVASQHLGTRGEHHSICPARSGRRPDRVAARRQRDH